MSTVQEIQEAIGHLSSDERAALAAWLLEREASDWDRQLEADIATGRLDWLRDEARGDLRAGRCTER